MRCLREAAIRHVLREATAILGHPRWGEAAVLVRRPHRRRKCRLLWRRRRQHRRVGGPRAGAYGAVGERASIGRWRRRAAVGIRLLGFGRALGGPLSRPLLLSRRRPLP